MSRAYPNPAAMARALGSSRYPFRNHPTLAEFDKRKKQESTS